MTTGVKRWSASLAATQRPASMRVRKITSYEGSTDWIVTSLNISCVRTTG